jgi:hypothetical protein
MGNVAQESQYGAASPNLFQFTPPIPGSSGPVAQQVALMLASPHGGPGLISAMNAAGSPAAAADLFMTAFERPLQSAANLPNREAQAQAAYAAGYARGGLVPGFAEGGTVGWLRRHGKGKPSPRASRPKGIKWPRWAGQSIFGGISGWGTGRSGKAKPDKDMIGAGGPFPFWVGDLDPINRALSAILFLDATAAGGGGLGGDAQKWANLVQWYTTLYSSPLYAPSVPGASDTFGSWASPSSFVITQDATGQTVTPYVSPNLPAVIGQLTQIAGYQGSIVADLKAAYADTQGLAGDPIQDAIKRRVTEVRRISTRVKHNIARIKALRKQITEEFKKQAPKGTKPGSAAYNAFYKARNDRITDWQNQIKALEKQNVLLMGGKDVMPSPAGGELGTIQGQLGSPAQGDAIAQVLGTNTAAGGLYDLQTILGTWITGLHGTGGDIDQQQLQLTEYQLGLAGLDPTGAAIKNALRAAAASGTPPAQAPLTGAISFAYQGQTYLAGVPLPAGGLPGMASGGIIDFGPLSRMVPWGGSFFAGGIVPGAPGEPRMVMAHGGEEFGGGMGGGAQLQNAIERLTSSISQHDDTVQQQIKATNANTSATRTARVSYGGGTLASETVLNLGVGA